MSAQLKSILLAYDGSRPAHRALELVADMAAAFEATVTVVSVVPVYPGPAGIDPLDDRTLHQTELREAREVLQERGVRTVGFAPSGDPARVIEKIAKEGEYDAVVLGSRRLGLVGRMLWGSTSQYVAGHVPSTVVVVP